jgi:hypothetical protein
LDDYEGSTSINVPNEDQFASFLSNFTDGEAFGRDMYGQYESDSVAFSFEMFGGDQGLAGGSFGVCGVQSGEAGFDMPLEDWYVA